MQVRKWRKLPSGEAYDENRFGSLARRGFSKNIEYLRHFTALSHLEHEKWLVKTSKRGAVLNRGNELKEKSPFPSWDIS